MPMHTNNVTEKRYDFAAAADFETLDLDSMLALVELTDCWTRRAQLRQRWIDRKAGAR
jgi:hypothetical protein